MQRQDNATWWQGDREIGSDDVAYIRTFVKRFPGLSRTELTCTVCEHLDWLTPAGRPKFEACAKLLARLEAVGELHLPALREDKLIFPGVAVANSGTIPAQARPADSAFSTLRAGSSADWPTFSARQSVRASGLNQD